MLGVKIGSVVRGLDSRFGIIAILNGEPRPPKGGFDLKGEKLMDWGWVCANLPPGPKRALEIGPGLSPIVPTMLALGYKVTAIDPAPDMETVASGFEFIRGDFTEFVTEEKFDIIVLCSVVEHIGLAGRYNAQEDPDGDFKAMRRVRELLHPSGTLVLTIPVGQDTVHRPWHRVYGKQRLPQLLKGFEVVRSRYLEKKPWGPWFVSTEESALRSPVDVQRYALGEMVLRPVCEATS